MPEITYHEAHSPYIETVADAFDAAGLTVGDWFADANDPRDGCITLAEPDEDGDEHCIAWDEEKGWFYGTSPEDKHGEIQGIWWIGSRRGPFRRCVRPAVRRLQPGQSRR